ncbi:MAG: hypothetical protein GY903_04250 [Fuerstiella sp.]|nr:hypothetical protein [Fuerstiella sp.]
MPTVCRRTSASQKFSITPKCRGSERRRFQRQTRSHRSSAENGPEQRWHRRTGRIRARADHRCRHRRWQTSPNGLHRRGGLAGNILQQLKDKFVSNHRDGDAFQFLQIDTDSEALRSLRNCEDGNGLSVDETIAIPLRTSTQYRSATELDLSWMSRRWLFNIPRSGQVQGIRPLGRLALCDHRHAVQEQIQERLLQVSSENAVRNATSRCGFPFCSDGIDVYVVASTTGGTSSGAVADVGLMVRNIAKSTSIPNVDIHGVLLHGTGAIRSATDVQDANTVSTLKELKHLGTPGMGTPRGFDQIPMIVTRHRLTIPTSSVLATA